MTTASAPGIALAYSVVALVEGEDGLVKADAARLADFAEAPHELRVASQVREDAPREDALG